MKETFEQNDAGFQYAIEKKGKSAYELNNKIALEKITKAKTYDDCLTIMNDWLHFFRGGGHIGAKLTDSIRNVIQKSVSNSNIGENQPMVKIIDNEFEQHIKNLKDISFEGIWKSDPYTIGIIKSGDYYTGYIIDAPNTGWKKNQIKLKIFPSINGLKGSYYMRDFSKQDSASVDVLGNNHFFLAGTIYERVEPKYANKENTNEINDFIRSVNSQVPYLEKLSDSTIHLRIPSFALSQKKLIDSILNEAKNIITTTPDLIIDVRGNGGVEMLHIIIIVPFLYTNPIRELGVEYYSTKLNNAVWKEYSNNPNISQNEREWASRLYKKLNDNIGKFVIQNQYPVSVYKYDTIYPYPRNVGIMIDHGCGSTTEQFLLVAKQCKKPFAGGEKLRSNTLSSLHFIAAYFVSEGKSKSRIHPSLNFPIMVWFSTANPFIISRSKNIIELDKMLKKNRISWHMSIAMKKQIMLCAIPRRYCF